jgi:1,4-alpha-glucan branching enzyme
MLYAYHENFALPLSHDEVVHGKGSLLNKMPGDEWQKFAALRAYLTFMWAYPGKKLLFMGGEFGQQHEWNHDDELQWELLELPPHSGLKRLVRDMNLVYQSQPSLYEQDFDWSGFKWIDANDSDNSVLSFVRFAKNTDDFLIIICNFTPVVRTDYRIGVPRQGSYFELVNSDLEIYHGSGVTNSTELASEQIGYHSMDHSVQLTLPPLSTMLLKMK